MDKAGAKEEAERILRRFVGTDLTTEALNEIEDIVNSLIVSWAKKMFFIHDDQGNLVKGIKIWYDLFDGSLRFAFRYPSQLQNIRRQA